MNRAPWLLTVSLLTACEGSIDIRGDLTDVTPGIEAPQLALRCKAPGQGTSAKMRLLWKSAYLAELGARLGPGAATVAETVGLSPATDRNFTFETAGSLQTNVTLESLADTADAVAAWSLSTDAVAQSVYGCAARTVTGAQAEACFTTFLSTTGARLLRRSLSSSEVDQLLTFFKAEVLKGETDGVQEGFRQGLASLLVDPDFLYLRDVPQGQGSQLDAFSLASRVSFALTGRGPDDELFNAARDGSLSRPDVLKTEVTRLLQSPDARARSLAFYRQWLGYDRGSFSYSAGFLNGLDATGLKDASIAELDAFVNEATWSKKGTPAQLLTSNSVAPLTKSLALIYGAQEGATTLPDTRAGLLTRVGMVASGGDDWHVVARGLAVVQKILCKDIPPPTINVADAIKQAESLKVSNVDRIKSVTSAAACAGCHTTINPLGSARSDLDAIGREVSVEKHFAGGVFDYQVPVVSSADLTVPLGREASAAGSLDLSTLISQTPEYDSCFAAQYTRSVLGRNDASDGCIEDEGARSIFAGASIVEAMTAMVTSPEFVLWKD